jgi:hypothetical protein
VIVELEEHLLSDGLRTDERVPVDLLRPLGETTLRRGCRDAMPDEMQRELARDAMDGMTLGH